VVHFLGTMQVPRGTEFTPASDKKLALDMSAESLRPAGWTISSRVQPAGRLRPLVNGPSAGLRLWRGGNVRS